MKQKIEIVERLGTWHLALRAARNTVSKETVNGKEPSTDWKRRMLLAEHSPIRIMSVYFSLQQVKSWISVHLVRHKIGIEHFVTTQRDDRTGISRDDAPQSAEVVHEGDVNFHAILNISRKRLCKLAHKETREVWKNFLEELKDIEPELVEVCVPDCIYRGHCYEMKSCGFYRSEKFQNRLDDYRKGVNV